jgi:methylated-DNA-[protein]-cysteine S-methyltransferase
MISAIYESPVGALTLISDGRTLAHLEFENPRYPYQTAPAGVDTVLDCARRELDAYFLGRLRAFSVPVAPRGTAFQRKVWAALQAIPYGSTRSYREQAEAIGAPKAVRAVGLANGRNPISIIIPCHRVIGADGGLTGYGGGIARKKFLLELERGERLLKTG